MVLPRQPRCPHFMPSQELIILVAFRRRGKVTCWKEFQEADDSILSSLGKLDREEKPDGDIKGEIERIVCQLYLPKTDITNVKELRRFLFREKQAECDRLPPTPKVTMTRAATSQSLSKDAKNCK